MTDVTRLPDDEQSPFDAVRQIRADGSEFWSARDLMGLMGYARWENLQTSIERAKASARNQGVDIPSNFLCSQVITATKPREDYELSRHAAYLLALNGNPNKPEVAAAQAYFVTKTREAEVQKSLNPFDLMRAQIDQLELAQRTADEAKAIASRAEARVDAIEGRHDYYSALGYARLHKIENTSSQFLQRVGKQASMIAKARGIETAKVPHAMYGRVNSYPEWVLDIAFGDAA
ncbi:BRO family protein [Rhodococcus marinonascens]|uniref:BRO family protein n=1 Tax=Rhodococcus marinonascens TaxID=38311 RepID=UPI000B06F305|nr:BRO family protein [Rhodococcus marinonascens]